MKRTLLALAVSSAFGTALANPTGPVTVSGATLISNPSSSVLQIVNTPGTIINWNGFSIASGETTRFVQDSAASAVLNRVTGSARSDILGRLESNGRVFLLNPNGILFGGSSVVDVAGLIASTRDISDANFLAGNYLFDGSGTGTITVQNGAQITTANYASSGGQVWLFAKDVTQEAGSTITAPQGQVVLAAGTQVQVSSSGLGNMSFAVTTDGSNTLDSLGTIAASQGAVGMFADFVNHRGTINAADGTVYLHGGAQVDLTKEAVINADGTNGKITFRSNDLRIAPSGNVHAADGQVKFEQYAPSEWTSASLASLVEPGLVVAPQPDGTFLMRRARHFGSYYEISESVLDSSGNVLSGPTVTGTVPTNQAALDAAMTAGVTSFFWGYYESSTPRLYLANGGWVQKQSGAVNLYGSNGTLLTQLPGTYSTVPLWDGTVAQPGGTAVSFYSANGTLSGTQNMRDDFDRPFYPHYATRNGMILFSCCNVSILGERWTKDVPAYTAGTPLTGDAGVAASFATRPGVAPVDLNAPAPTPPPPPVVRGSGSGARLDCSPGGLCAPEVPAALGDIDAARESGGFGGGAMGMALSLLALAAAGATPAAEPSQQSGAPGPATIEEIDPGILPPSQALALIRSVMASKKAAGGKIDETTAAAAVLALMEAGGRKGALSPDAALGVGTMVVDNGELEALLGGYGDWGKKTPQQALEAFDKFLGDVQFVQQTDDAKGQITLKYAMQNATTEAEKLAIIKALADAQVLPRTRERNY